MNRAVDFSKIEFNIENDKFIFGYAYNSNGFLKINKGFVETWYAAQNDFNTLTKKSDIGGEISEKEIYGVLDYSEYDSFFIRSVYRNRNSNFYVSFNILRGKRIDRMDVNGTNTNSRFLADVKYYYSKKNILTHKYEESGGYGYGMSLDLEYGFKSEFFDAGFGIYNIFGFISWKNITCLQYSFDSQTKYVGEDGYYHYKPFGVGKYVFDVSYRQKLPVYMKYGIKYKKGNLFFGDRGVAGAGVRYDELYTGYKNFKIGYVLQSKTFVFGVKYKKVLLEFSEKLNKHTRTVYLNLEMKFKGINGI